MKNRSEVKNSCHLQGKELNLENVLRNCSHNKRKDSLETRTQRAVLRTYVENQAILEPILLYCASKCKRTKRPSY